MTRISQFANDLKIPYNKAKNLVNKGRKLKDGGSSILENTMNKVKPVMASKGKSNNLGMQSVKYGLDNNPEITAADPKAKFIAANKEEKPVTASKGRYQSKASEFRGCGAQVSGKKFKGIF